MLGWRASCAEGTTLEETLGLHCVVEGPNFLFCTMVYPMIGAGYVDICVFLWADLCLVLLILPQLDSYTDMAFVFIARDCGSSLWWAPESQWHA